MRQVKHAAAAIALVGALAGCDNEDPTANASVANGGEKATNSGPEADCQLVGYHRDNELARGCWAIQVRGLSRDSFAAQLELPAGFAGNDAWVWLNAEKQDEWGAITLMSVGNVYPDPCNRTGKPPELGPSVEDFALALASQEVTRTTTPVPVSVDGYDGVYVELSAPDDFDARNCRGNELILWEPVSDEEAGADPAVLNRYWVLDLDGQHVVLVVSTLDNATDETGEMFTGIAESATFDRY